MLLNTKYFDISQLIVFRSIDPVVKNCDLPFVNNPTARSVLLQKVVCGPDPRFRRCRIYVTSFIPEESRGADHNRTAI